MNKILKTIFISSIAVFGVCLLFAESVQAQPPDLTVEFQNGSGERLFEEANFLPGDSETRWVKVTNNTSVTKSIATKISLFEDLNDPKLGDVLYLDITSGGAVYYHDTLFQFYQDGVISLGSLNGGDLKKYDFIITFIPEAGNDYQGKILIFDFQIGEDVIPLTTTTTSRRGGGGTTTTTTVTTIPPTTTTTIPGEVAGEATKREFFEEGGEEGLPDTTTTTILPSKFVAGTSIIGPFSCPVNLTMSGINPLLASLLCLGQGMCDSCLSPWLVLLLGLAITFGGAILVKKGYE